MTDDSNDNDPYPLNSPPDDPDAHGQAAVLLVESLIHGLIAKSVISVANAVEIVEIASDAGKELMLDRERDQAIPHNSIILLDTIRASLLHDIP